MLPALTKEVSSSMEQMASTSEKLSSQAERLKEAIELFKIERRIRGAGNGGDGEDEQYERY